MRRAREELIASIHQQCPHHVDLIPPPAGYSPAQDDAIWAFLDARIGAMDMYGLIQDGHPIIRYCFLKEKDAALFRETFSYVGTIINFPKAANGGGGW